MTRELEPALAGLVARTEKYLFFDYDGTLAPIVSRHEEAAIRPEIAERLAALGRRPGARVAVVTGRGLEDIRGRLAAPGLVYAALHGLRIRGEGLAFDHPEAARLEPAIRLVRDRLRDALRDRDGVVIEDKGLTVAVHFRLASASDAEQTVRRALEAARTTPGLRALEGKKVVEIRPDVDWDKGRAVELILEKLAGPRWSERVGVLYAGDDRTDEDAFERLGRRAVTIRVGLDGPSAARFRLRDPAEVEELLERLAALFSKE